MKKKTGTFGSKLYRMFLVSILIPFFIALLAFVLYSVRVIMEREERNAQNILNSVSQSMDKFCGQRFMDYVNCGLCLQ